MKDKNFTIIEDIFDTDDSNNTEMNNKKDLSFLRTLESQSIRPPYPMSNVPSLSYDEDMIKNKLSRQINPRSLASQYNSMSNNNRIMQPSLQSNVAINEQPSVSIPIKPMHDIGRVSHLSCRNIYDHIESCPFCQKYYKQSNRTYILIIVFLVLIILILLRQNSN